MAKQKARQVCSECGDTTNLIEHPSYSGDRLCRDCLISFHEITIEELESEIQSHKDEIKTIRKQA